MRVGLLGVGRIGRKHADALASLDGVELLIGDVDQDAADEVAQRVGARALPSDEVIEASDAIVVAAATDAHAPLTRAGIDRGIPVFCEKPLAGSLGEASALAREIKSSGIRFQLGFQRRFDAGYLEARRLLRSGELGTLYCVRMAGHDPAPPAESYIPVSGGLFHDFSVHDFDILRWLTGSEVVEAYADGSVRGFPVFAKYDDVDTGVVLLRLDSEALVAMTVGRHDPRGYDVRTELFGSRDVVSVGLGPRQVIRSIEPGVPPSDQSAWPTFQEQFADAYRAEIVGFIDVARGVVDSACTARDGVEASRIAEAATRSRREHRPVRLDEIPRVIEPQAPGSGSDAEARQGAEAPAIEARKISKHFGHVTALREVDLTLWPGEVLGVVGDNGAGKSTLMKVLSGMHAPSSGALLVGGEQVQLSSPRDARELGIEMVYQDLALAGNLRIDENIFLGRELVRRIGPVRVVDHGANKEQAMRHLEKLRIEVKSVMQRVEELSGGQRQAVAIARATAFDARVVIMDEPTAALAVKEVRKVLDLIRDLRTHGIAVILISHRLDDIFYVCDRVMALFHGRNFAEAPLSAIDRNEVIGWIMGNREAHEVPSGLDLN